MSPENHTFIEFTTLSVSLVTVHGCLCYLCIYGTVGDRNFMMFPRYSKAFTLTEEAYTIIEFP